MPYPPEYTDAYNNLIAFRNKILTDMVGARVKALLDAGHDCMDKYKGKLEALGVEVTLFNDLMRRATVFKLHGMDLGEGKGRYVKGEFLEPQAKYPLFPPYLVTQRNLPQVDIFSYTARTGVDIKEMSGGAQLQGMITLQCPSGSFHETPDAENALYDFYFLYPQAQYHGKYTPLFPILYGIQAFSGNETLLQRQLHFGAKYTLYTASLSTWFDALVQFSGDKYEPISCIAQFSRSHATPEVTIVLGQYRVHSGNAGFWGTFWTLRPPSLGWFRFSAGLQSVTEQTTLWFNHFPVTISVNNPNYGYTIPEMGTYTRKSGEEFIVEAVPYPACLFDRWYLDGVDVGTENPYHLYPLKPCELKAVFGHV